MSLLTGCFMPVALSAILFTAFAWGKGSFNYFALVWQFLPWCSALSHAWEERAREEHGTWLSQIHQMWHCGTWYITQKLNFSLFILFALHQTCYDHIPIFSCTGSSIPTVGWWISDTLEFRHQKWLLHIWARWCPDYKMKSQKDEDQKDC